MKVATLSTLCFATLALSSPAPAAQPGVEAVAVAQTKFLEARDADAIQNIQLNARAKKPKPGSNSNDTSSAGNVLTPSLVFQAGAFGLGVIEVVRLWG